jgi:N-acetylglucosaminyldiphosphoundecaprenol N-acetyl-beta-D-mannosaminyltransferase
MSDEIQRIKVLGVGVSAINMPEAVSRIGRWIAEGEKKYVCVTGVHGVMECQKDTKLLSIHNESGLTVPDGMPLVWCGRCYGHKTMNRVYGPDLMLQVCGAFQQNECSHFLYGGNDGVAQQLKERLVKLFPKIRIIGTFTPPFRPLSDSERADLKKKISELKPDVLWVGLSTPKQERFMAEFISELDVKVMIGVGAAFDIITGRIKDAPDWMKRCGLQWLHRLGCEPRRLWKRYILNNPRFILKIGIQILVEKGWKGL